MRYVLAAALTLAACGKDELRNLPPPPPAASMTLQPAVVEFGDVRLYCEGLADLTLANDGDLPVTLGTVEITGPFSLLDAAPTNLEPGDSVRLVLAFVPDTAAIHTGTLSVTTDLADVPLLSATLRGRGVEHAPSPLDLVFVVDVSTTMDDETNALHDAANVILDRVAETGTELQLGLTTFVNDVVLHNSGQSLDRTTFFAELESQLTWTGSAWHTNGDLSRNTDNTDMPENVLDALYRSADEFAFRVDTTRYFVLITDDTFVEPPEILSGNNPVQSSYDETALRLLQWQVVLHSIHAPDNGVGLSEPYGGRASMVEMTGGGWHAIEGIVEGQLDLSEMLTDLVEHRCE